MKASLSVESDFGCGHNFPFHAIRFDAMVSIVAVICRTPHNWFSHSNLIVCARNNAQRHTPGTVCATFGQTPNRQVKARETSRT